jgi:Holliday junction DNA helicase RuvA
VYDHLHGRVAKVEPARVVLEVGGIGFDVTVPLSVSRRAPRAGESATLLTHLVVREDELRLIGFWDEDERRLFRTLINLTGVGPALALQVLSAVTPRDFALAVERQDATFFKKIKGVGEKTAKRMILELKGAKTVLDRESALPAGPAADAALALETMGLSSRDAAERVDRALKSQPDAGLEDLIKLALR